MRRTFIYRLNQPIPLSRLQWQPRSPRVVRIELRQISEQTPQRRHTSRAVQSRPHTEREGLRLPPLSRADAPRTDDPRSDLSSTRPAPLILPEGPRRDQDQSIKVKDRVWHLIHTGRAYVTFYKAGIKNVFRNIKEYNGIRTKFRIIDVHRTIRAGWSPEISRRDFQLYLRTKHDMKVLVPFSLVVLVCGEFTPLVIMALGSVIVPYPCRIPQQVKKDLQRMLIGIEEAEYPGQGTDRVDVNHAAARVHGLDPFGLSSRKVPLLGTLLWQFWTEPRLRRRMDEIISDALLILKEGGAQQLEVDEVYDFGVKIRNANIIRHLLDHQGNTPMPEHHLQRTQRDVQAFIEGVGQALRRRDQSTVYDPHAIFASATRIADRGPETSSRTGQSSLQ